MTFHLRMVEARIWIAPVGVSTARAVSAVPGIAGAAVQAWPVVVAGSVFVAVVLISRAYVDLGAGAASLCVSGAAGAGICVGPVVST